MLGAGSSSFHRPGTTLGLMRSLCVASWWEGVVLGVLCVGSSACRDWEAVPGT